MIVWPRWLEGLDAQSGSLEATLVTSSTPEFEQVKGLKLLCFK